MSDQNASAAAEQLSAEEMLDVTPAEILAGQDAVTLAVAKTPPPVRQAKVTDIVKFYRNDPHGGEELIELAAIVYAVDGTTCSLNVLHQGYMTYTPRVPFSAKPAAGSWSF